MIENECFLFRNPCPNRSGACLCAEPDGDSCPLYRWFKAKVLEIEKGIAPVVHGRWEVNGLFYTCSLCRRSISHEHDFYLNPTAYKFCPYCGAKMDGERREQYD